MRTHIKRVSCLCVFLFSYTSILFSLHSVGISSFCSKPHSNMAYNPSDRFKSKPNDLYAKFTKSKIKKWSPIKTKQKGSEMNGKLLLQNTHTTQAYTNIHGDTVWTKWKRKWAHRIIYESVENYALRLHVSLASNDICKHKTTSFLQCLQFTWKL